MQFLASHGQGKTGNDTIFGWFARYQAAAAAGADAVNGTVGALLNDDGTLAINTVVDEAIRQAPAAEFAALLRSRASLRSWTSPSPSRLVNTGPSSNLGSTPAPPLRRGFPGALYLAPQLR
ncbi:MAG: hypothetical protein CM15mP78_04670 [Candidatus Poseidoniales archaeon]|nr:MAG: hypothetical protein CM15mP78_04670 [Candidatus Poseidoniales archaeon]